MNGNDSANTMLPFLYEIVGLSPGYGSAAPSAVGAALHCQQPDHIRSGYGRCCIQTRDNMV